MFLVSNRMKVITKRKGPMPIGDVELGDYVEGKAGYNKVIGKRITTIFPSLWEISTTVGTIICTANQPILTNKGWAAVNYAAANLSHRYLNSWELTQHHEIETREGLVKLEAPVHIPDSTDLVCVELELDGDHTYFVNNILVHNKGGGGGGGTSTTVTKTDPPAYLEPYLTDIAKQAQAAYKKVPQGGYSGQLVASPTDAQQQALQQQKSIAQGLGGFGDTTKQLADMQSQKILSGGYTAPANTQFQQTNLGTADAVNAYLAPVQRNLMENIIPTLQSDAIEQGAYGGGKYYNNLANQIRDNYTTEAANIAAQIGYGEQVRQDEQRYKNFELNQQLMPELMKLEQAATLTTPELLNTSVNQQLMPSGILAQAGQAEQLFQQDVLDEAYQQYLLDIQGPFAGLDQYASVIAGMPMGGTSTATGTAARPSGGSSFLSGALGGGAMAYGLGSAFPASMGFLGGPVGIAGGAILGGLLGL